MARKIKTYAPLNASLISNDSQSLQTNFQTAFGAGITDQSIVVFLDAPPSGATGSLRLVFAKAKNNGQPDLNAMTVSLELPCPPYCGQRGSAYISSVNVMTTT